jgi:hypothetical protein
MGCTGCAFGVLGTVALSAIVVSLALAMCGLVAAGPGPGPTPTTPSPGVDPTDPSRPPVPSRDQASWGGSCIEFDQERDRGVYNAYRGTGSARRLSGKVAILHFRLRLPDASFGKQSEINVDAASIAAKDFYLQQIERHRQTKPDIDLVSWPLSTPAHVPAILTSGQSRVDAATQKRIREAARRAIETALDSTLEALVRRYRNQGYDEVGLIVYLPVDTQARAFAWFAASGSSQDFADAGYIFAENKPVGQLAYLVAHEGLHLFGADDLYRVTPEDSNDAKDLMNDTCSGLGEARIGDSTAYGVGWTSTPPARRYRFRDF